MNWNSLSVELAEFQRSFDRAIAIGREIFRSATPREVLFLQLGLRVSHIEEALARGEVGRAREHLARAVELVQSISRRAP